MNQHQQSVISASTLYVVPTPIGSMRDGLVVEPQAFLGLAVHQVQAEAQPRQHCTFALQRRGFVGAGGIGQLLFESIQAFDYRQVSAIAIVIVVAVTLIDMLSQAMRKRLL